MIDIPAGFPPKVRKHYVAHFVKWSGEDGRGIKITCYFHDDLQPASPTTAQKWFANAGFQLLSYGVEFGPAVRCVFEIKELAHE